MTTKKSVLILCTGNSARSQMAEGLWRRAAGDRYEVFSAGTKPTAVRPEAVDVLAEFGIDISGQRSKSVDQFAGRPMDLVITVCDNAREACPIFPAATERLHWPFPDPAVLKSNRRKRLAEFRNVRDLIQARILSYLAGHPG